MPVEYRYDNALKAAVSTVKGVLEQGDVIAHLQRLQADDAVPSGFFEIVDFSLADDFAIKASGASAVAMQVAKLVEHKNYQGTAFFAPNDLSFGMARMFQAMMESRGQHVEIYRDWDELAAVVTKRLQRR